LFANGLPAIIQITVLHTKGTQEGNAQEPLNPRKYCYFRSFDDLPGDVNHIVVIVVFGLDVDDQGQTIPNNYVATAFFKHIWLKG